MQTRTALRRRAPAGLAAWVGLLVVAVALLTTWSDPRVATPALGDLSAWGTWAAGNDPVLVAVALLRLVLIGLTWYLLGATAIQVAARLTDNAGLLRFANALSIPLVRQVVSTGLGVSLAATMVTAATGGARPLEAADGPAVASATGTDRATADGPLLPASLRVQPGSDLSVAPEGPPAGGMVRAAPDAVGTAAGMRRVATDTGDPVGAMERTPLATPSGADDSEDRPPVGERASTWTVRPGDHLWLIAEAVLAEAHGVAPDDDTIAPYWLDLIEANRPRLPDPANPDLLYAGIELEVPPVPGPARRADAS